MNVAQDYFSDLSRLLLSTSSVDEPPPPARIAGFRQSNRQEVTVTTRQPTALRQRMLDDMRLRNMAAGTCRSYVRSVADFSAFHGRSPDELTLEDVRDYQLHLVARGLKAASICPIMSALRFLYAVTLDRPEQAARIPLPRKADPLPAILSPDEVARLLGAVADLWMRALLTTVYAAGLRVSEVVGLQATDIDSGRMTIRVREGKGGCDRYVMLSPQLLAILRAHWCAMPAPSSPAIRATAKTTSCGWAASGLAVLGEDHGQDCACSPRSTRSRTGSGSWTSRAMTSPEHSSP